MKLWFCLPLAVLMLWPATAVAQEEGDSPQWWVVFTEDVAPENVAAFEENAAAAFEVIKAHAPEGMVYYTLSGPEVGFSYAVPMEGGLEGFATLNEQWMGMIDEIGWEEWKEMGAEHLINHSSANFYVERPDLSYMPEALAASMDEMPVRHYDWLYPKPGMDEEFVAAMKEWVAMYEGHGTETGWLAYQAVTGDDLPLYVLITPAASMADYHATGQNVQEMLGEAGAELMWKSMALLRDYEATEAQFRPELSLLPPDDM